MGRAGPAHLGDQWGPVLARTFDGLDRVPASSDPDRGGTVARYTATSEGTATTTTDAAGGTRTTTADALGRTTTDTWSRGAATTTLDTTWDGLGLDTDGDGTADADAIGLPVLQTTTLSGGPLPGVFADRSVYDRAGRTVNSTRVLPEAWDLGGAARSYTTGYAYREDGSTDRARLPEVRSAARLVLPAEELVVGYDAYGRPATVLGAGAHTSGTVYTPAGLPAVSGTEEAPGSGAWTSNRYDGAGQLTSSAWYTAGQTGTVTQLADTSTAYDQAGNPVATAATGGTGTGGVQRTCATYDGLRRLDNWWTPGTGCAGSAPGDLDPADPHATSQAWVFDPATGLPTSSSTTTTAGTTTTSITHETGSHRPAAADSTGPAGAVGRAFTWNPDGTPATWTGPDGTAWTLGTDPAGNTDSLSDVTTSIGRALAPDGTLLAEKATNPDGSTVLTIPLGAAGTLTVATAADATATVSGQRDYPRPDGTLASARTGTATTDTHAYRTDPQGTPLQTAGTTVLDGTTAGQARRYTPYGQQRGPPQDAWPTRSGWLGKQQTTGLAVTGLIRLGARDYDPTLGVFTTTDPLSAFGNPGSLDPYAYAGWNPLAGSDPDGTWPTWKGIKKAVKSGAKWAWDHKAEIAGAVASVAAGAAFCAATAGVGCLVIGGAIAGAVGSATTYGVQVAEGKRTWNTREFLKTTAIGAVVGGVTGGLAKGGAVLASRAVSGLRNAAPGLTTAIADTAATARATLQRAASSAANRISTALRNDTGAIGIGRGAAANSVAPGAIRFSQSSLNGVDEIAASMRANGWVGKPIDVVRMPDGGLTAIDNTRVLAAHQAGIDVQATIRGFDEALPEGMIARFTTPKGGAPSTWGRLLHGSPLTPRTTGSPGCCWRRPPMWPRSPGRHDLAGQQSGRGGLVGPAGWKPPRPARAAAPTHTARTRQACRGSGPSHDAGAQQGQPRQSRGVAAR